MWGLGVQRLDRTLWSFHTRILLLSHLDAAGRPSGTHTGAGREASRVCWSAWCSVWLAERAITWRSVEHTSLSFVDSARTPCHAPMSPKILSLP